MSRLYEKYKKEILPELQKELGIANVMAVPRLEKIIVNVGVGDAIQNIKLLDTAKAELGLITGPAAGRRPGQEVDFGLQAAQGRRPSPATSPCASGGCTSSSTGWSTSSCPASATSAASRPSPSTGGATTPWACATSSSSRRSTTPRSSRPRGMNITIVTSARHDKEAFALLKKLGMPFRES